MEQIVFFFIWIDPIVGLYVIAVNLVSILEERDLAIYLLALRRKAGVWYITRGYDGGMVNYVAHGKNGHGLINLLFNPQECQSLCNCVDTLFEGRACRFAMSMARDNKDNRVEVTTNIVNLPNIQLK